MLGATITCVRRRLGVPALVRPGLGPLRACSSAPLLGRALQEEQRGPFTLTKAETGKGKPVVVMFGWTGSRDKALAAYARKVWNEAAGFHTLRGIAPHWDFLLRPAELTRFAMDAFQTVQEEFGEDQAVIVHCFSNGGTFVLAEHLRKWEAGQATSLRPSNIAGLVFDSAPAYLHVRSGARAVTESLPPGLGRSLLRGAAYAGLHAWNALAGDRGAIGFWRTMQSTPGAAPELYVYSQDDAITEASDLEALVSHREAQGVDVHSLVLQSSPHVSHLRSAPQAYATACAEWGAYAAHKHHGHGSGGEEEDEAPFSLGSNGPFLAAAAGDGMDPAGAAEGVREGAVAGDRHVLLR